MNVKGLIISSSKEVDKMSMYDCEISVPALKIHLDEKSTANLLKAMPQSSYTNIIFMINGNPIEVSIHVKEDKGLYANAKEISKLDLSRLPLLKENTLVMKFLENQNNKPKATKKMKF